MGFFDYFTPSAPIKNDVDAALQPMTIPVELRALLGTTATRQEAMSVPTIARARNILCATAGSLPFEQYNKISGAHIEAPRVINQPDPRVPGSFIYTWLYEDIWLYGNGYGMVMELYADGRISSWTRIDPLRVSPQLNTDGTLVIGYYVDGKKVPASGVGSIINFPGLDEGVLARAGKTIKTAAALETAARNFAEEPVPSMVLKSNGTNLTAERINKLLSAWNGRRKTGATAFLNADVDLQALGLDPEKLGLNSARQYIALELARACGVPAYFVSAEPNTLTYSNLTTERKSLVDFGIKPLITAVEQRISMPDFATLNTESRVDLDDFLRGSALERAQVYQILHGIQDAAGTPVMSIEEIRKEEDLIK